MRFTVYADSVNVGQCRSCGAVITWAELISGKRMPFDGRAVTHEHPTLLPGPRALVEIDTTRNASHFATCPHAARHRKAVRR